MRKLVSGCLVGLVLNSCCYNYCYNDYPPLRECPECGGIYFIGDYDEEEIILEPCGK